MKNQLTKKQAESVIRIAGVLDFEQIVAQALGQTLVKQLTEEQIFNLTDIKREDFSTDASFEDFKDSVSLQQSVAGEVMREQVKKLKVQRKPHQHVSSALIDYMILLKQKGYTTRTIEEVLEVSDSVISRKTAGFLPVRGRMHTQCIELLDDIKDLDIKKYRKLDCSYDSYLHSRSSYIQVDAKKLEDIQLLTRTNCFAAEIAEKLDIDERTVSNYMPSSFSQKAWKMLVEQGYRVNPVDEGQKKHSLNILKFLENCKLESYYERREKNMIEKVQEIQRS